MIARTLARTLLLAVLIGTGLVDSSRAQSISGAFSPNAGQWPEEVEAFGVVGGTQVQVREGSLWFVRADEQSGRGVAVELELMNSRPPEVRFEDRLPGLYHEYGRGGGEARSLGRFATVRLAGVWEGIDVVVRADGPAPRFDFEVEAGADVSELALRLNGGSQPARVDQGQLALDCELGSFSLTDPVAWEVAAGPAVSQFSRMPVNSAWRVEADGAIGFELGAMSPERALVIDPSVIWSTFIGGSEADQIDDVSLFTNGDVLFGGRTGSPSFPSTPGAFSTGAASASQDLIFGRLSADGQVPVYLARVAVGGPFPNSTPLLYSVLAGGDGTGYFAFTAPSFTSAFEGSSYYGLQPPISTGTAIARLSPAGDSVLDVIQVGTFSLFTLELEGQHADGDLLGIGLATSPSDYDLSIGAGLVDLGASGGSSDYYIMRLEEDLSAIEYSILFGTDAGVDQVRGSTLLDDGSIFCNTRVPPTSLPTTPNAWQPVHSDLGATTTSSADNYFFNLSADGKELLFATYYGAPAVDGSNGSDRPFAIAAEGDVVWLVNEIEGDEGAPIPAGTPEYLFGSNPQFQDTSVLRFDWRRQVLLSRIRGSLQTTLQAVALADGSAVMSYQAPSGVFDPTPGEPPFGPPGAQGLMRFNALGEAVLFNHGFGGSEAQPFGTSVPLGLVASGPESLLVGGATGVSGLPTTPGAPDDFMGGNDPQEGFLQHLDMTPAGVRRVGEPSGGCELEPRAGVLLRPVAGESGFGLSCAGAPPGGLGVLALSAGGAIEPAVPLEGIGLHVDLGVAKLFPAPVDASGFARVSLAIPLSALGVVATVQFGFVEDPIVCPKLLASDALELTVFMD